MVSLAGFVYGRFSCDLFLVPVVWYFCLLWSSSSVCGNENFLVCALKEKGTGECLFTGECLMDK